MKPRFFRYYPLTLSAIAIITVLCLIPIAEPPLRDVPFIDKWTHMVLFGGLCGLGVLELTLNDHRRRDWLAAVGAVLYGGAIELMQAWFTICRTGDWFDFYADAIGAIAAFPLARLFVRLVLRKP